jgi:hypothetical protein
MEIWPQRLPVEQDHEGKQEDHVAHPALDRGLDGGPGLTLQLLLDEHRCGG